jgi:tyrosine-protein kinase Etk/Wzc
VAIVALAVTIPWVLYLKSQPPIYEANALIQFNNFAGNDLDLTYRRTTQLTSRPFAERLVSVLGLSMLIDQPEDTVLSRTEVFKEFKTTQKPVPGDYVIRFNPDYTYSWYMIDREDGSEREIKSGFVDEIVDDYCEGNGMSFKIQSTDLAEWLPELRFNVKGFRNAVERFRGRILVKWEDRTGTLMNLTLSDSDPKLAAEMTNRLAELFIQESIGLKKEGANQTREILDQQLQIVKKQLDEKEIEIKRFKERYGTDLTRDEKQMTADLSELEKDRENLNETKTALNTLLAKREIELQGANGRDSDPKEVAIRIIMNQIASHPIFDDNTAMRVARMRLEDLETSWQEIVDASSPNSPRAKTIMRDIKSLHTEVETISRREVIDLEGQILDTAGEISDLEGRLAAMPQRTYELNELMRQSKVLETDYREMLDRYNTAQMSVAVETEDIEILESAIVPEFPTNRDKKQKAAMGGVIGLFLGMGLVLAIEFLDKSIKSADDVKKSLKLPVIGTIPLLNFDEGFEYQDSEIIKQIDQQLVTHDYSPTPIGEAYRSLRTNLMFTKDNTKVRSLVFTSNEPGDGKSFTASNISITLAQLKSSTLLIDADLRRGVLHNTFGVAKEPGFSNYLTDMVPLQSILQETQIPNLTVVSCGSLIPNPSELLGSHQMQRFLDEVRRKFELVVFDTPPLNAATDSVVVGTQVDATVIVVRAGKTSRDLAKSKLELYNSVPAKVLGVVLNGTTSDMAHPGYSYYHY